MSNLCLRLHHHHIDLCYVRHGPGHYRGKLRINGVVRSTMLYEKTSLSKLPGAIRKRQRSCFRVRLTDLSIGATGAGLVGAVGPGDEPDAVIGRIVSFLAIPAALKQASAGSVLARVRLYHPVPLFDVTCATASADLELWHHNYIFLDRKKHITHLLPVHLIGPQVVVIPHVQKPVAKLGYCLVLQQA